MKGIKIYDNNNITVFVEIGAKGNGDFKVKYLGPKKRKRTPKHIHLVIDLLLKKAACPELTKKLLDHIIYVFRNVKGVNDESLDDEMKKEVKRGQENYVLPASLQVFQADNAKKFEDLNDFGEYSVEFLLVIIELIMIQEKTNYPSGDRPLKLFEQIRDGGDIYSISEIATGRSK